VKNVSGLVPEVFARDIVVVPNLAEGFAFMMPLYKRTLESLEVQEAEILAFAVIKGISMSLKLANDIDTSFFT